MITTLHGDCRDILPTLPERSVQCVVTSPPYYGLRRYSDDPREIGQEATPGAYVAALVEVFRQIRRVLRDDGTVWLNLGDSYTGSGRGGNPADSPYFGRVGNNVHSAGLGNKETYGMNSKNLMGIPWRVALALQDDGWILRADVIWNKPNCMPESVTDRPTRAHEYVFLLAKNARYFYDAAAIEEESAPSSKARAKYNGGTPSPKAVQGTADGVYCGPPTTGRAYGQGRNKRSVWNIPTQPYSGAHYATMPEALIEPCILAGSSAMACEHCGAAWVRVVERESTSSPVAERHGRVGHNGTPPQQSGHFWTPPNVRDLGFTPACACPNNTGSAASVILDPFAGSGTALRVAARYQRNAIGIELNATYIDEHIEKRTDGVQVELFV